MERVRLQAGRGMLLAAILIAAVSAAGCSGSGGDAANVSVSNASGEQGFRLAPQLTEAVRRADGALVLKGAASPGAAVRLESPSGVAQFAVADAHGVWRMTLPASPDARLFALSMSDGGRVSPATGYLFVMPDGAVARLVAGGGSAMLTPDTATRVSLVLDYDNRAAATLSGVATPGASADLRVDGIDRGQATADRAGRFVLLLNEPLTPGPHDFDLAESKGDVRFSATIGAPATLHGLFAAQPFAGGWRVDWVTPGGGQQTTLVFAGLPLT